MRWTHVDDQPFRPFLKCDLCNYGAVRFYRGQPFATDQWSRPSAQWTDRWSRPSARCTMHREDWREECTRDEYEVILVMGS